MFVRSCGFAADLLLFDLCAFCLLFFSFLFPVSCAGGRQAAALELQGLSILVNADTDTGILRDVSAQNFLCELILEFRHRWSSV